jgi:hypothetical protein
MGAALGGGIRRPGLAPRDRRLRSGMKASSRKEFEVYSEYGRWPVALALFAAIAMTPHPAIAAGGMDAKQVQIVAKVFNFLEKKPDSGGTLVITPGAADMAAVKSAFASLKVVEAGSAEAAGAFAVFVGSTAEAQSVKGRNPSVITISGDVACVDAGVCILAVATQPKVVIYVSRAAANGAGVGFDTSFKMLMTER